MPSAVFLDWSAPLLPSIADQLLPASGSGPLHLGHCLILAPTKQAGRRLREYLATSWRARGGTAILSLNVHPPSFLFQSEESDPIAHPFDWLPIWQQTLTGIEPGSLPALMPQQVDPFSPSVALEFGQRLQRLREELLDAGLDLAGVAASPLLQSEQDRWQDLARLEGMYRSQLKTLGLRDPTDAKRENLARYQPPPGVKKIILAGVPDPSPVILKRLQVLDSQPNLQVEVWIHAPAAEKAFFDEWGLPGPEWQTRHLGRETEPDAWMECLTDPAALCVRMQTVLQDNPQHPDLAFGVLDDSLILPLQHAMEAIGHQLYHPKPVKLAESPTYRLLDRLQAQRVQQDPVSLRALWRESDLLNALQPNDPRGLLREWEHYAAAYFPENIFQPPPSLPAGPLASAWETCRKWVGIDDAKGILQMLEEIFRDRKLDPGLPAQRFELRQIKGLADILQEAARRQDEGRGPAASVLLQVLKNESIDPPRVEGTLTAEGWLELAYHPAPALLLTGFQEGKVPAVNKPDPFLPNQLREELGLRSDRDWLARDAYLFHCMIMSRAPGAVRVWVLKRDREGSPQLPSRLLFACDDTRMLARCDLLFSEPPPPPLQPPPHPGLLFKPAGITTPPLERLSVTAINQYLACPTRFYFQFVLGLQINGDTETEPNAATFGTLIHKVLEEVVARHPDTLEKWYAACENELDQQLHRFFGPQMRMSLQVFRHSALARLRAAGAVQLAEWEAGWEVVATERKVTRTCQGVTIVGKIDRIDQHPERGFRIVDYKTSDNPEPPAKTHLGTPREGRDGIQLEVNGKIRQWSNLQLPLYRWLAAAEESIDPGQDLQVAYFNLPKAVQHTGIEDWPAEAALAPDAERCLQAVITSIQQGKWHPTSAPTQYDDFQPLLHHGADWVPTL